MFLFAGLTKFNRLGNKAIRAECGKTRRGGLLIAAARVESLYHFDNEKKHRQCDEKIQQNHDAPTPERRWLGIPLPMQPLFLWAVLVRAIGVALSETAIGHEFGCYG